MQTLYIILPPRRDAPPCVWKIVCLENRACIYSHTAVWLYERCRPYHISAFFMHQTIIFMQTLYIILPPRRDALPCVLKIVRLEKTRLEKPRLKIELYNKVIIIFRIVFPILRIVSYIIADIVKFRLIPYYMVMVIRLP